MKKNLLLIFTILGIVAGYLITELFDYSLGTMFAVAVVLTVVATFVSKEN